MKNYPEPSSRAWYIAERVAVALIVVGLMASVYFAAYFANILLTGGR